MVISGGVNIYPAEIEMALLAMTGVRDCAVFGIPDEEFGEKLCAHIEPDPEMLFSAGEVAAFLRERLADFKVPRVIKFETTLPREDSGKIIKRKLRELYWAGGAEDLERPERLAVTDEPLARQMYPFAFVFDDPADYPRAPAVPLEDRQGGIGVLLRDEDAKADPHVEDLEHL